tara:strand:+ start:337 stop:1191 length:855 start_codon:yes stop_codon:yes gene_type:complete
MNRYEQLKRQETHIAVLGLNVEGIRYALSFSKRFKTLIYDQVIPEGVRLQDFLIARSLDINPEEHKIELANHSGDLRAAGVFYLNGLSTSIMDWASIKDSATEIARSLNVGDWVVFGPHIDPDLAEVVLVEILERNSGLKLGSGFEIAFHPLVLDQHNFSNMSNEMKMSHNLIVDEVERILDLKKKNEFGSNQINYQNQESELKRIQDKIKELWIPMLNDMTRETFMEFMQLSMHNGFLDAYGHLRLSTETRVNWRRFFKLVLQFGIKAELRGLLRQQQDRLAV